MYYVISLHYSVDKLYFELVFSFHQINIHLKWHFQKVLLDAVVINFCHMVCKICNFILLVSI